MISKTISQALFKYLSSQLENSESGRRFFRLDGFDTDTYVHLLQAIEENGLQLSNKPIKVVTTDLVKGFEKYNIEIGKSATWYRNNVEKGTGLILIFNQPTSDAQSLKDVFPVTESYLSGEAGIDFLIRASFSDYHLISDEHQDLRLFISKVCDLLYKPQLRDLTAFFIKVNDLLSSNNGKVNSLQKAISEALPYLGLFRCTEFAEHINTPRGDKLLLGLYQAARKGEEVLDERVLDEMLGRLNDTEFEDDSDMGGFSAEVKKQLLTNFLTKVITDRREFIKVLSLEWKEVEPILQNKSKKSPAEKLMDLYQKVEGLLDNKGVEVNDLPEEAQDALNDLKDGLLPDNDELDALVYDQQENLGKNITNELRRLNRAQKEIKSQDFISGLITLLIEMLFPHQGEGKEHSVKVEFNEKADSDSEAINAFQIMYGGIEDVFTTINWDLKKLWDLVNSEPNEDTDEEEAVKSDKNQLVFKVTMLEDNGIDKETGNLVWLYRTDSPVAATVANLDAEFKRLPATSEDNSVSLAVPLYNTCPNPEDIGDLDLGQPIRSLGVWYSKPGNLREAIKSELQSRTDKSKLLEIDKALDSLEISWAKFVLDSGNKGILASNIYDLLESYDRFLKTASEKLIGGQEVFYGFRVITQAWIVGPQSFDQWAVVPLVHPIKLHWFIERTKYFNKILSRLLRSGKTIIEDERRFRQEISTTFGSSGYPALLALQGSNKNVSYFLPVDETEGYELFRHISQASIAHGLDPDLVTEDEGKRAAEMAADELAKVVRDYIETYPFVRDGLEVYLVECRNSALPGLLVEKLEKLSRRQNWPLRLTVNVHTKDRGAPLYQRVKEWIKVKENLTSRVPESLFPKVTLKVIENEDAVQFFKKVEDKDLVILADVLAEDSQDIEYDEEDITDNQKVNLSGYLPLYRAQQAPFEREELSREIILTTSKQPSLLIRFYNAQYSAAKKKAVKSNTAICFKRSLTLSNKESILQLLHETFNWVVCYDTTIDRFLLEATFPESVQVIRYSLGLGVKRQHNLTVSSSNRAQDIVVRRLASRLIDLLPSTPDDFRFKVSNALVNDAKRVSGDIVLRAAGPGAYLNELIGLMLAKHETEKRYLQLHQEALISWIYLDDFSHWFDKKFPDLLFVAIPPQVDGKLQIHVEVIETKCVGASSFEEESHDAQKQVIEGVNRLGRVWAEDEKHLDAPYWYDQFYRAVVGNLAIQHEQEPLWASLHSCLPVGNFILDISGHSWIFCYDSNLGIKGPNEEYDYDKTAPDVPDAKLSYHHYGKLGVRKQLKELVEGDWGLEAPSDTWSPVYDQTNEIETTLDQQEPEPVESIAGQEGLPSLSQPSSQPNTSAASIPVEEWVKQVGKDLEKVLRNYDIKALAVDPSIADIGPSIVRMKVRLKPGEQLGRLQRIAEDMARELKSPNIPLIDNILGTNYVGIDLPRSDPKTVNLLPLLDLLSKPGVGELPIILGQTPDGKTIIEDLSEFPHLLVAGATNSGKSVFLRSLVLCLIKQYEPEELKILIIDPKRTDFSFFNKLPHLLESKVITEKEEARDVLLELVSSEMVKRQEIMAGRSLRIKEFNVRYPKEAIPPIVAIIDEYAQLISIMNKKAREAFERDLMSLAAVARSTGIHLVLATQRPSSDVVTGTLKANLPTSISFKVATSVNSRIVIDQGGAENLLGRGDMLFRRSSGDILRIQAPYIDEITLIDYLKEYANRP